jgi:CRISPR/Cas system-associated endonuclease Cas1
LAAVEVDAMWANDDAFGVRDGVLVLSKRPSLKVEQDRLVIGDGYDPRIKSGDGTDRKPHELRLTRAECTRGRLRHVIMIGEAGWCSNAAHLFLRDVGCALSLVEPNGSVVFSTGARGPDRPWLRRQQALVGVGVAPGAVEIARALLSAKLAGQVAVLRLMNTDAAGEIAALGDAIRGENSPVKVLTLEAQAGQVYWRRWENLPISFARQRPGGFVKGGKWRETLPVPDHWLRFGLRASLLTGKGWRATDPGNACLNFVYALLRSEMTIALAAQSLDPGLGLFHRDHDNRPSLALDAMEPVRPLADAYVASFLAQSNFLLRDFAQASDGELRLTHPLRQHLGRCTAIFRDPCEHVAAWLARAFDAAGRAEQIEGAAAGDLNLVTRVKFPTAPPRLPALPVDIGKGFLGPREGYRRTESIKAPKSCAECGRALHGRQKRFCSKACNDAWHVATGWHAEILRIRYDRAGPDGRWFRENVVPALADLSPTRIAHTVGLSFRYAQQITRGEYVPARKHWPALAALAGVEMPALIERASQP